MMPTFPYFRAGASRKAMIAGRPVPVQSCWNGIGGHSNHATESLF